MRALFRRRDGDANRLAPWAKWLIATLAAGVLFCCLGGALVLRWGFSGLADDVYELARDEPAVTDRLGDIVSVTYDFWSDLDKGQDHTMAYTVVGTEASGTVTVQRPPGQGPRLGVLLTDSGETVDLQADGAPPEPSAD